MEWIWNNGSWGKKAFAEAKKEGNIEAVYDASESGSPSIEEIAEENEALLQPSDDVTTFEVLNVRDGSISSLSEVVTGDRPVLVWFWSPH